MARITNLADLSLDCVLLIFKQLQSLNDQVNLAQCCTILRDAFVYMNHQSWDHITDNDMTLKTWDEWNAFLWMCGENVKSFELYNDDEHPLQLLPLVSKYCINLESIQLHNVTVVKSQPFLLKMFSLKKIYVRNYKSTSKDFIKSLLRLPNINSIGLDCFERTELQELRHFKNLEELQICDNLTSSDFSTIIKSMKNLKILELRNSKKILTTNTLKQLTSRCPLIEKLSLSFTDADLSAVAHFSHLNYLQVICPDQFKTRLFKALAKNCAPHLEFLILHRKRWINEEQAAQIGDLHALKLLICKPRTDECVNSLARLKQLEWLSFQCSREITEIPLVNVVRENSKLRFLNIGFCSSLGDEFVMEILPILMSEEHTRPKLELYANSTNIGKLSTVLECKNLRLYFTCSDKIPCNEHYYYEYPEFDRSI